MKGLECINGDIPTFEEWEEMDDSRRVSMAPYLLLVKASDHQVGCCVNGAFLGYCNIEPKEEKSDLCRGEIHFRGENLSGYGWFEAKGKLRYSAYNQDKRYVVLCIDDDEYYFFFKDSSLLGLSEVEA